jgi:hypothetical protein
MRSWVASTVVLAVLALAVPSLTACSETEGVSSGQVSLASTGGTVVVECIDLKLAKLVGWQAYPGYTANPIVQGPSAEASINFESAAAIDMRVAIRCVDGQPRLEEFEDEDEPSIS